MSRSKLFWGLLLIALLCRIVLMVLVPLTDPSEARYAEIARVMADSQDWVTPWFAPGVPFWGKPPAAFWGQALAINLFGVSEFTVRLPALLASLLTMLIIYGMARNLKGVLVARWTLMIYSSSLLPFVMAGAVLTDPFLVLGSTWIMAGIIMAPRSTRWYWRYGLFLGTALGLLAKGPLVLVLAAGAVLPWLIYSLQAWETLRAQPWWRGSLLTVLITLPWYIAAEIKTPGFLYYFLVGEHLLRFIQPGWAGDLYGGAHDHPRGTIWLYYLVGTFPWVLWLVYGAWTQRKTRISPPGPLTVYLLGWALFTPLFFTLSGNILWTYVLPALPAFSLLLADVIVCAQSEQGRQWRRQGYWGAVSTLVPVLMVMTCGVLLYMPEQLKSEKNLVAYLKEHNPDSEVVFIGEPTYSAQFYSAGEVSSLSAKALLERWQNGGELPSYVIVPNRKQGSLPPEYQRVISAKNTGLYQRSFNQVVLDEVSSEPGGEG